MAKTEHSRVRLEIIDYAGRGPSWSTSAPWLQPQAGKCGNLTFFPRSKRAACVHAAHKHTVCVRERAIRGMFGIESSVFVGFEGICVHVCVSVPQFAAYTKTCPQDPVGNS